MSGPLLVTCAHIRRNGKLLLARRADNGLWEMPGGKAKPGESLAACLRREIREELGCGIEVGPLLGVIEQREPKAISLHAFSCLISDGAPKPLEHLELAWVEPELALEMELCPADRRFFEKILA